MSYPSKPSPAYDYETFQAENPASPPPGNELTNDFAGLKTAVDANIDFLTGSFQSTGVLKTSALPTAVDLTTYTAQSAASAAAAAVSQSAAATSAASASSSATTALAAAAGTSFAGTSASSITIGTGSKSFTASINRSWGIGTVLLVSRNSDALNFWMLGIVISYVAVSGATVLNVFDTSGSGTTDTAWNVSVSAFRGATGPTGATGSGNSIGSEIFWTGRIADIPSGWLPQNFVAVSRTTYATLFALWVKSHTFTITIASPGVVTWTTHGLDDGDPFVPTTSGALPTGLTASTTYYVKAVDANTFQLAATPGGAAIVTTGSQSGTHTGVSALCGLGNGSTTFNTQDKRGLGNIGNDMMGSTAAGRVTFAGSGIYGRANAQSGGTETVVAPLKNHSHSTPRAGAGSTGLAVQGGDPDVASITVVTSVTPGDGGGTTSTAGDAASGTHNNMPPVFTGIWIVRAS